MADSFLGNVTSGLLAGRLVSDMIEKKRAATLKYAHLTAEEREEIKRNEAEMIAKALAEDAELAAQRKVEQKEAKRIAWLAQKEANKKGWDELKRETAEKSAVQRGGGWREWIARLAS